ncbi:MAG: flavin monoamine oxidase family protein [Acidobacteria bacterium]|nr:flavin monoamine oxidase family protein [Acidobacteriota bacterium]
MHEQPVSSLRRRDLLRLIGSVAGTTVMYEAMSTLGLNAESTYKGPIKLEGNPRGASVVVLGAGLAGMVAALELRRAGYKVQILEYQNRAGGRCWTIRGGDTVTELGGEKQRCEFDSGLYLNPGPWRIPSHHHGVMDYCRQLGVALEPFVQVNHNAYVHAKSAYGGKPQRFRHIKADYEGGVAELLAKAVSQGKLDEAVTTGDKELLLQSLRNWGALDRNYRYVKGPESSDRRGFDKDPGGGLDAEPVYSDTGSFSAIVQSRFWQQIAQGDTYYHHNTMFQPSGGMDMIAKGFEKQVGSLIRFNTKVTEIKQDEKGVTVNYVDATTGGGAGTVTADWCVCTLPLTVLGQLPVQVGAPMLKAIQAVPYSPGFKVGLQFKRRFWEQDEEIYGGISYTDLPISQIGYPSYRFGDAGKGVLLAGYTFGVHAYEFASLPARERLAKAVEYGAQLHPQYKAEYENGISVAWHRVPWNLGCSGAWSDAMRAEHYKNLCAVDGRIVLAGEHASYIPAWQEGAILSSLDAITRLHRQVVNT